MTPPDTSPIRLLVVDDEPAVQAAYRKVLAPVTAGANRPAIRDLRARLFDGVAAEGPAPLPDGAAKFDITVCGGAEAAVAAVTEAVAKGRPFAVAFLDMRMPPGPDGLWAAEAIRTIDEDIDIVFCTAYADVDPAEIGRRVPPQDKLFYIAKPFHPHEIRQMALALGRRWHAERALAKLAYFDALTGLPNRSLFRRLLETAMEAARRDAKPLALLYFDLDNFKKINDTLGHSVGDELLKVMAARLRDALRVESEASRSGAAVRDPGNVARLGGDEFVVLLQDLGEAGDADGIAERLIRALEQPMRLERHDVVVTPSVGIALYPRDGEDVDSLFRHSDLAMYFAKRQQPGTFAVYEPRMSAGALNRLTIESKLRDALARREFSLNFQPQFELSTGLVSGMEALLRWTNPELGAVPPAEFIPVAEETGLIHSIGEWVLRTACETACAWRDEGLPEVRIAVNLSALQFTHRHFPELVARILRETGLEPRLLELELTESLVMKDDEWAKSAILGLKATGVSIAIDDFGIGHSSFGRLRDFAVDRLKIDSSFVQHMSTSSSDHAVAAAIITMAKSLGIGVVAEGVEEFPQLLSLQDQKCDHAQGYLLARPLSAPAARAFLERLVAADEGTRTQRLRRLIE